MAAAMTPGNRPVFAPRNSFSRILLLTVFCLCVIIFTLKPTNSRLRLILIARVNEKLEESEISITAPDCSFNSTRLQSLQQRFGLGETIEYGRRHIRFHRQDIDRESITKINADLFPAAFESIDLQNPPSATTCLKPLDVPVPRSPFPKTVDASELLFGISTTYGRLHTPETSPLQEWAHWLTDGKGKSNGAGLIVRLIDASEQELDDTRRKITSMGMDVKVYPTNGSLHMALRYLSLLPALYNDSSRKSRKWLVMCDDDTFFPSMHSLLDRLSTYDHRTDLYIGTLSEDVNNIQRHGSQAFGGAGVFFSVPLAAQITKFHPQCSTDTKLQESNTGWGPQGDILLRKCIYENTEVRLTVLRDLHQLDIMGDPAGFYESGLAPLSLHHFKGGMWHKADPLGGAQVIHACGEDCFLQRFQTTDDFIISNGYSVAYYPHGINFDVNQVEGTFGSAPDDFGWNLDFMLGPKRVNLNRTGRKAGWELKESTRMSAGAVRQVYIRKAGDERWVNRDGSPLFDNDGVIELIWSP